MTIQDYGPQVEAVGILFLILAWISVSLRCYVRFFMTHFFGIDDWLAIITLVAFSLLCFFVIIGARSGTGRLDADLTQDEIVISMRWWYGGEISYVLTTCLLKIYIGAFLKQICILRSQILVIWAVIITFSTLSTYYLFLMAFQCHPVSYFWERYGVGAVGTCVSTAIIVDSSYVHSVFNAVSDWTLATLPIFLVWNLRMSTRTKISVAVLLSMGAIGSLATVIRIQYIHELNNTKEFLYHNALVSIWSTVEPGMGIAASSLACTKPLFRDCFSKSRHSTSNATNTSNWTQALGRRPCSTNNPCTEELGLHEHAAKSIRVETVIDIHSAQDSSDIEAGIGRRSEGSEITTLPVGTDNDNRKDFDG